MVKKIKILFLSIVHRWIYKSYKSIDFIPIWNFKQVEKTGDLRYIIKNIDYESLPKVYLKLNSIWENLYEQYATTSNPEFLSEFKNSYVIIEAKRREYLFLFGCIKVLSIEKKQILIDKIRDLGYKFDDSNEENYYNSIIDLQRQLIGLNQVIQNKNLNFETKYLKNKPKFIDIEEILVMFTQCFGSFFDSKKLTVRQYIIWLQKYNKIANEQKSQTWQMEQLKKNR
jgi:hypothetical protein